MLPVILCLIVSAATSAPPLREVQFERRLDRLITVRWEADSLETHLRKLAADHQINLIIAGNVDRTFSLNGNVLRTPLEQVFEMAARLVRARAVPIGEVLYIGPAESADRAATAAFLQRGTWRKLPRLVRNRFDRRIDLDWDGTQSIAELAGPLVERTGFRLATAAELEFSPPPDQLKQVRVVDALLVLLAQCGRTFDVDVKAGVLTTTLLPETVQAEETIRVPATRGPKLAAEYRSAVGGVEFDIDRTTMIARGHYSALRALRRYRENAELTKTGRRPRVARGKGSTLPNERFSLSVRNVTIEQFAQRLAKESGMKIEFDDDSLNAAGKSKLDRMNCSATNLTLEELLRVALSPSALDFVIRGNVITIRANSDKP